MCGMNSLGYASSWPIVAGEMAWHETVTAIKKPPIIWPSASWTWFRKMPRLYWFNLPAMDEPTR